jgi:site-specific recombinase
MEYSTIRDVIESALIAVVMMVIAIPLAYLVSIAYARYTGQEGWDEEDIEIYERRIASGEWTYQE